MTHPYSPSGLQLADQDTGILSQGKSIPAQEKGKGVRRRRGLGLHRMSSSILCGVERMAFRYILLSLVVLLVSTGFSLSLAGELSNESHHIAEALRRGCWTFTDCLPNEYCGGRGTAKRCIECFDCAIVKRKPRMRTYEGGDCATHQTQCGECEARHREAGGVCIPEDPSTSPTPASTPVTISSGTNYNQRIDEETKDASTNPFIFGISLTVFVVVILIIFIVYGVHYFGSRLKSSITPDEETAGLTIGSYDNATAPPDEYLQPPLYAPPIIPEGGVTQNSVSSGRPTVPRWDQAETANALPFNRGNGAGTWKVRNENAPMEQTGDGNDARFLCSGAADPSTLQRSEDSVDAPNTSRNDTPGNEVPSQVTSYLPPRTESSPSSPSQQSGPVTSTPRHSFHGASNPIIDPIVGTFSFGIFLQGSFRPQAVHVPPTYSSAPLPPNAQARMAVSAPTSPRRAVDDTHIENLLDLNMQFLPSNLSLDSGTGTGEHERSLPSRSVSGGDVRVSDMDDSSMFDEDELQNHLGTHEPLREVPDFDRLQEHQLLNPEEMELDPVFLHHSLDEIEE